MDSISQFALGAAIGTAVMGRKVGYKSALIGGVVATLPDLDVYIPMGGDVADFTYHRSFSHSLLILAAISPLISWLICKIAARVQPLTADHKRGWRTLVLLTLLTHPLLDAFTIYGTQLLWPLDDTPVGLGSIFIIDPLYTLPLLLGVGAFLAIKNRSYGLRSNAAGLLISCGYLCWSALAQQQVTRLTENHLALKQTEHTQVLVQPTPFNTLLWRILVMQPSGYQEGFYSLFDSEPDITLRTFPSNPQLLQQLPHHWPVERLQWFSKGFYSVSTADEAIVISDLRMGLEPDYVFRFKVAQWQHGQWQATPDQRLVTDRDLSRLKGLWQRIWDSSVRF